MEKINLELLLKFQPASRGEVSSFGESLWPNLGVWDHDKNLVPTPDEPDFGKLAGSQLFGAIVQVPMKDAAWNLSAATNSSHFWGLSTP